MRINDAPFSGLGSGVSTTQPPVFTTDTGDGNLHVRMSMKGLWVWPKVMALHRQAEFNKGHVPAFLAGEEPRHYVCVYPFVRSLDWYLLDPAERREMLADTA